MIRDETVPIDTRLTLYISMYPSIYFAMHRISAYLRSYPEQSWT